METKLFDVRRPEYATVAIKEAAAILREGGLVAFPTETVYGLGGDALNPSAAANIYKAKGRPSDNPLIVHIADRKELARFTERVSKSADLLMDAFWPGPLTMIFEKLPSVPYGTTGGLDTVAIRMPDDRITLALIRESGCSLAGPSANLSGRPSPTKWEHVYQDLNGRIDGILQSGACRVGIESTILDMTGTTPMILRPGMISPEQIGSVLGESVEMDPALYVNRPRDVSAGSPPPKAPGMKYKHYAPKAEMVILQGEPEAVRAKAEALAAEKEAAGFKVRTLLFSDEDLEGAAKALFAGLRACDDDGMDFIVAGALKSSDSFGFAIMNRMLKSAGYRVIEV